MALATKVSDSVAAPAQPKTATTALGILGALSFCHLLNDTMQSVLPAIYPMLKGRFLLDFGQVRLITLAQQLTASLLQPVVWLYTDRRPKPYSLAISMAFNMASMILLPVAGHISLVLAAVGLVGLGS